MKVTKSQLKQIIKEELTDEDKIFLMKALQPVFSRMEKQGKDVEKLQGEVHSLHKDFRWLNGDLQSLEDNVTTINDKLSTKKPGTFASQEAERVWTAKTTTDTNPRGIPTNEEIRRMVKEELDEVYSQKQRRWACAQSGESRKDFKGKPSLSSKEAEEMCKDTKLTKAKKK